MDLWRSTMPQRRSRPLRGRSGKHRAPRLLWIRPFLQTLATRRQVRLVSWALENRRGCFCSQASQLLELRVRNRLLHLPLGGQGRSFRRRLVCDVPESRLSFLRSLALRNPVVRNRQSHQRPLPPCFSLPVLQLDRRPERGDAEACAFEALLVGSALGPRGPAL